jgi:hypothetical protein
MTNVKHIQTQISATIGLDDGEGNITPQEPITVRVNRLSPEVFQEAYEKLVELRDQAANANAGPEQAAPDA